MDIGTGLAILGICGTIITAIIKFVPSKKNCNGEKYVEEKVCNQIEKNISNQIDSIKDMIGEIKNDIKAINGKI